MAKLILVLGAAVSMGLGFVLWRAVERSEFPPSGE